MSTRFKIDYSKYNDDASPIKSDVKIKTSHGKLVAGALTSERNKSKEFTEKVSKGLKKYFGKAEDRFLSKIKKIPGGCWEYPNRWIQHNNIQYQPKAFAAEYYKLGFTKEIVWQTCRNKKCVNPKHLIEMSREEQAFDTRSKSKVLKGDEHHQSKLSEKDVLKIKKMYDKLLKKNNGKPKGIATIIHNEYSWVSLSRICQIIKK